MTYFFKIDFLIFKTKKAFIQTQKAFSKALILYYFYLKCHICIQTNASEYAISAILSQITLSQPFFNYVTDKSFTQIFLNLAKLAKLVNGTQ